MEQKFPENRFENFGSPLMVVLFSGNLEIPEISCSTRYESAPWPSSFSREKLQDGSEPFESTIHWMQNNVPQFEPVLDCLFSTLGSVFLENCGLVVPNFPGLSSLCLLIPGHILSHEKSSQVALITRKWCLSRSGKY